MKARHATRPPFRLPLILATTMVLSLAGLAAADPGSGPGPHPPHGPPGPGPEAIPVECQARHFAEHGAAFDRNRDGRLDRAERRAMHQAKRQEALNGYDKDGDGRLSKAERDTMHHDRNVERFEALDRNRDAEIARSEAAGSCTPVDWNFADIDADGSGSITWNEFERAGKLFRPRHQRRRGPRHGRPMDHRQGSSR